MNDVASDACLGITVAIKMMDVSILEMYVRNCVVTSALIGFEVQILSVCVDQT